MGRRSRKIVSQALTLSAGALALALLPRAHAASSTTWTGNGGNNNWSDGNNWNPTGTPGYVRSPYGDHNTIDVRDVPSGALVRDTSTGGIFRNP